MLIDTQISLKLAIVYTIRLKKLVQKLHLVMKMLFLVLVYLLKNFLSMIVIVDGMKIILMSQDEC